MNDTSGKTADRFRLLPGRIERLRSDDRGSLTLLAGMMVFVATIFGIIAMDTNMAIQNRIVTQNAVDSAADAAALWQARGCNMLQMLNNLHYDVDKAACIAEGVAATACVVSAGLVVAEAAAAASLFGAPAVPFIHAARMVSCVVCDTLPAIDYAQDIFYQAIMPVQEAIVDVTPFLAFGYANACAKGSGADNLFESLNDALNGALAQLGVNLPDAGNIGGAISAGLGSVPIFAAPLDPQSLKLFVNRRDNDGTPPLKWPEEVGIAGDAAGDIGCSDAIPVPYPTARSTVQGLGWDSNWGWNDQYFFGHPGFMTWLAGKKQRDELLGLGSLKWINGGEKSPDEITKALYTGESTASGNPLKIPGFVGLASSQVEGNPVIMHGDVDAAGKLIKVYLPGNPATSLDQYWIYH